MDWEWERKECGRRDKIESLTVAGWLTDYINENMINSHTLTYRLTSWEGKTGWMINPLCSTGTCVIKLEMCSRTWSSQ
jgi:hypothetical protein